VIDERRMIAVVQFEVRFVDHRFSRRFNRHINIRILAPASHLN
jgi:hypothetical protein